MHPTDRVYVAACKGYRELAELFIRQQVNNNNKFNQSDLNSGLFGAAREGHRDLIALFAANGANDWEGAMFAACIGGSGRLGRTDIVKLLRGYRDAEKK